jgi:hypothetical protein
VRLVAAASLTVVWQAPCTPDTSAASRCRHLRAWEAVAESARDCRLGSFDSGAQWRRVSPLEDPIVVTLQAVPSGDLLVERLSAPIAASAACARSNSCAAPQAVELRDVLFDCHRRVAAYDVDHNNETREWYRWPIVEALLIAAAEGESDALHAHVDLFVEYPRALTELLHDLTTIATYNLAQRRALRRMWPMIMDTVLDAIDAGRDPRGDAHWGDEVMALLIPTPAPATADADPDTTLRQARQGWPTPTELADRIDRWLSLVQGLPRCLDYLIKLLRMAPLSEQASRGLPWTNRLIDGRFDLIASRSRLLPEWLNELRAADVIDTAHQSVYLQLVDGLAAHGDRRTVQIQRREESK